MSHAGSHRHLALAVGFWLCLASLLGCSSDSTAGGDPFAPRSLSPYPNPFGPEDPSWSPQPNREKPLEVVVTADGAKAYVSLQGIPDTPGRHVAVVTLATGAVKRVEVGSSPTGLALHPAGRALVVFNRFSNFVSIIDTVTDTVVQTLPIDFYAIEGAFTPDGRTLLITNRWRDALAIWDVGADGSRLTVRAREEPGVAVDSNPRDVVVSPDGATAAVAALTGTTVSLVDIASRTERVRIRVGAPVNGLAFIGPWLYVATLSASTHHSPHAGPDTDGDGVPGDGTPNVNFQDLQNEIAVYAAATGEEVHRYTSDTICCKDYRDVDPRDTDRLGHLLPPEEAWIVGGALPEQLAVAQSEAGVQLVVTYSASNQLQTFAVDVATGALTAGPVWTTAGHAPHGIAVTGRKAVVAHRLSETVGVYDLDSGQGPSLVTVGDVSAGAFPATDAELGELFNYVTAPFTVDGDQSCAHCHREDGNVDKAFSMPLTAYGAVGQRMTMAYRGAADSRPWFMEAAMDETNFRPVMNEFARVENFCCADYTLWPEGAPSGCGSEPPAACGEAPNAGSANGFDPARPYAFAPPRPTAFPNRDRFYLAVAQEVFGRQESFGDGLFFQDPVSGERAPIALSFQGITRALGLFLMTRTRLLPNPNPSDLESVRRGEALFHSPETACAACHLAPSFGARDSSVEGVALDVVGPVVTPLRGADGTNLDLLASGFVQTFPLAVQDRCEDICGEQVCSVDKAACDDLRDVMFGAPPLRGIWDRADGMLHDGRARGLREVLCTPGHPALQPGETGYNERDGVVDSHGGTSHLTPAQIQDLIAFIESL